MRYSFHHFLMLTALAFSTLPILGLVETTTRSPIFLTSNLSHNKQKTISMQRLLARFG